jgi:hypothetical protein
VVEQISTPKNFMVEQIATPRNSMVEQIVTPRNFIVNLDLASVDNEFLGVTHEFHLLLSLNVLNCDIDDV